MTRDQERMFRAAWTRFDRATAYGCAQRGVPYAPALMRARWREYAALIGGNPSQYDPDPDVRR